MKKLFFLIMITFSLAGLVYAQNMILEGEVSGVLNQTYTYYRVIGDITVPIDSTLTISAGVEFHFYGEYEFNVFGTLVVNGTSSNPVIFTNRTTYPYWKGIRFEGEYCAGSIIENAHFKNTKGRAAVSISQSNSIQIKNCTFTYITQNNYDLIGSALVLDVNSSNNIDISHNLISNNVSHQGNYSIVYINNTDNFNFSNNTLNNNKAHRITIFQNDNTTSGGTNNIVRNIIHGNTAGARTISVSNFWLPNNPNQLAYHLESNSIYNNSVNYPYAYLSVAGLYLSGGGFIVLNNNIFRNINSDKGGGIFVEKIETFTGIFNNKIFQNEAFEGGGIYLDVSPRYISLENNEIFRNIAEKGGGIAFENYLNSITWQSFKHNTISLNIADIGSAIYMRNSDLALINCTLASNMGNTAIYAENDYSHITKSYYFINSILWDNYQSNMFDAATFTTIDVVYVGYSTVRDGISVINFENILPIGNIYEDDPMFKDLYYPDLVVTNPLYPSLPVMGGDYPNYIGAYPYSQAQTPSIHARLLREKWNWISFPKLPRLDVDDNNEVDFYDIANLFNPYGIEILQSETEISNFDSSSWTPQLDPVSSIKGYKVRLKSDIKFTNEGTTLNPNTVIPLYAGQENWIGYFIPYTQLITDAFADMWDSILSVKGYDGSIWVINSGPPIGMELRTISFGDMVVVDVPRNTYFVWNQGRVSAPRIMPEPILFTYEELADYTPIFVEYVSENPPIEIGAFVNDKCVGASVYESEMTEIRAYLSPEDINQEIEIVFAYNTRTPKQTITDYGIVNPKTNQLDYVPLIARPTQKYHHIKITNREKDNELQKPIIQMHQNYPNPFNPTTKISFYLSHNDTIQLSIYNIKGQKIKDLYSGNLDAGKHNILWHGDDMNNKPVASGIYLYQLKTSHALQTKKMLLIK